MTDTRKIQGAVQIESDSTARVAFDLMEMCASSDKRVHHTERNKEYWLSLYRECSAAVSGSATPTQTREIT